MKNKAFWSNKVVAVTGAHGFIGSAIVRKLRENNIRVIEISRRAGVDILNFPQLLTALKDANYIINTAALDGNSDYKHRNSVEILNTNIRITTSLLAAASQLHIYDLTFLSSAVVYGQNNNQVFDEKFNVIENGNQLLDGYALSKRLSELLVQEFSSKYCGQVLIPRPTNIYGKNDPHMRVIEALSNKISAGEKISILGDGTQLRNFIYIEDFVSILFQLIESDVTGILNVASTERIQVIELARLIAKILHKKLEIDYVDINARQLDVILDVSKLESLLKYDYTPLKDGLSKTI